MRDRLLPTSRRELRPAATVRGRIGAFVQDKFRLAAMLILVATVAGHFGTVHWLLELACHFRVQYLALATFCLLGLLAFRDWRWSAVAFLSFLLNGVAVLPLYSRLPAADGKPSEAAIRVMLANVLTSNQNSSALLELIKREAPDVVALQEIDERWVDELRPLDAMLPFSKSIPRSDNFGIGLWSRYPLRHPKEVTFGEFEIPSIQAGVEFPGRSISFITTHPVPPGSRAGAQSRNEQLAFIAGLLVRDPARPTVLIGDLNLTMWSPYFARFARDSGLVNARTGFGVLPTWHAHVPILKIPLDHCFVSPSMHVRGIRTGESVGSDHLPLIVDLTVH